MKIIRAMAALLLAYLCSCSSGCGGGQSDDAPPAPSSAPTSGISIDDHGFGWQYDVQGATGLRLRYSPVFAPDSPLADVTKYEQIFAEVKACTGLTASAPLVIAVPFGSLGLQPNGSRYAGKYFMQPALIVVSGFAGSDILFYYRHELVHHLLFESTGDPDERHTSPFFSACVH
jgi:hypothetical protein